MHISETGLIVRYAETDRMGIVHHSHYPVWFEAGRTDFIRKMGFPYSIMEESGVMLPVIELKCFFKGSARYEDNIVVRTMIKEHTGVRLAFRYEVYDERTGNVITEGETLHIWTNRDLKPVNIKKFRPDIHELILKAING